METKARTYLAALDKYTAARDTGLSEKDEDALMDELDALWCKLDEEDRKTVEDGLKERKPPREMVTIPDLPATIPPSDPHDEENQVACQNEMDMQSRSRINMIKGR